MKLLCLILIYFLMGCAAQQMSSNLEHLNTKAYQNKNELTGSYFKKSENNFSDKQIQKLLMSRVKISNSVKLAIIKLDHSGINYGNYYQSFYNDGMTVNSSNKKIFSDIINKSGRIKSISLVPTFLVPNEFSVANLRDTAALMQANYLVIIKTNSLTDFKYNLFSKNEATATANMEVGVVDVMSGAIPFTSLITGKVNIKKNSDEDFNSREFQQRARNSAEEKAYKALSDNLIQLFNSRAL